MKLELDEGFQFGLGVFETIAVRKGRAVFLEEHLARMNASMEALEIPGRVTPRWALEELGALFPEKEDGALKLIASGKNQVALRRENHYTEADYEKGFALTQSPVLRNETSPLTCHKTLNYGDCILEKRSLKGSPFQEKIFLNSRGELTEGTVSNLFFVDRGRIVTPKADCGLLPGIVRGYLFSAAGAEEKVIRLEEVEEFEECFLTNSLMGIMPVRSFGTFRFPERRVTEALRRRYQAEVLWENRKDQW
mgnify:CR=1 FL=1